MPLFEYTCRTCGHTLEVLQRDARVLELCGDECVSDGEHRGQGELVRLVSPHNTLSSRPTAAAPPPHCQGCGQAGSCWE